MVVNLDNKGNMAHSEEDFANEQIVGIDGTPVASTLVEEAVTKFWKPDSTITNSEKYEKDKTDTKGPHLMYEICSDDGFKAESSDPSKLWKLVFEAVQEARIRHSMNPLSNDLFGQNGLQMLGLTHDALAFLLEQLPGARKTKNYEFKHHKQTEGHKQKLIAETLNPSGCARSETFKNRKPYDIFSWLANPHRQFPDDLHRPVEFGQENILADPDPGIGGGQLVSALKRATSLDLPMAMRFRHLAKNAKEAVGVFSSSIHGRGLYCKRTISAGEMVIEYAGEEIRAILCDKRERKYDAKGIGCYMFKINEDIVIDATMAGNNARFINHSCDPNCYSKPVDILGKEHIIIFALRIIEVGEELTYDYKFPKEEDKILCNCRTNKCKGYMN